jgi:hypothetical protein
MTVETGPVLRSERTIRPAPWGVLAAIDLSDCDVAALADPDRIRGFVADLVPAIGMQRHGPTLVERFGTGELEGWSALQFIETSSVTVHADEVGGRCFVDVFSCRPFDAGLALQIARHWFGGLGVVTVLERGG